MKKINRFEDIESWQRARNLSGKIYTITSSKNFSVDFGLQNQMRRAAVSVMSNIAEGFERGGNKEFRQFLSMAKGSTAELRSQLYVALDAGYIDDDVFESVFNLANETGRLIGGFIRYLKKSDHRGFKYTQANRHAANAQL